MRNILSLFVSFFGFCSEMSLSTFSCDSPNLRLTSLQEILTQSHLWVHSPYIITHSSQWLNLRIRCWERRFDRYSCVVVKNRCCSSQLVELAASTVGPAVLITTLCNTEETLYIENSVWKMLVTAQWPRKEGGKKLHFLCSQCRADLV